MNLITYTSPRFLTSARRFPFGSLAQDVDRLFDLAFATPPTLPTGAQPALDLWEQPEHFVVRLELPGVKKDDVQISLHENVLTLAGERKQETKAEEGRTLRTERQYGSFRRSVTLPSLVNGSAVTASFKDGVLTVTLPKAEEAKPRQITVNAE